MTLEGLMQEAAGAVHAGDFGRAEPLLLQIAGLNPRDAQAWHMLAVIAIRGGRGSEAIAFAERAHQLERRNPLYLNTLGVAHGEAQQLEEAVRWFRRALKERPSHAESHYNLGKAHEKLGQRAEAERCYLRARQLDPANPGVANNLGALYSRLGRRLEALPFLQEARAALPHDEAVAINCSIAILATSGADAAIRELARFVAENPGAAAVRAELGRRLLAEGRLAEGWREYAWRHGRPATEVPDPRGRRVLLLPDQGLGDQLFFLRFAPMLRERAAHAAFACPPKLLALLNHDPVVELRAVASQADDFDLSLPVGELPRLVGEPGHPAPLAISVEANRISSWRDRLAALGPGPYLGVTWRAGSKRASEAEFAARGEDPLFKEIAIESLARAVGGWRGSVLVLQRLPAQGEIEAFGKALGRRAHDLTAVNDDLADMAALLALIDEYVGVSNTNMHLRAGIGKQARVLVPFPPEFRWLHSGSTSPWFPGFTTYRQSAAADWTSALNVLSRDITH